MPSVIITENARNGLEKCRKFLSEVSPHSSQKAAQVIAINLKILERFPDIGRIDEVEPQFRELIIPFGGSGYIALYRYDDFLDQVLVLAFKHQKEAGF